jgi:hypothetical protein
MRSFLPVRSSAQILNRVLSSFSGLRWSHESYPERRRGDHDARRWAGWCSLGARRCECEADVVPFFFFCDLVLTEHPGSKKKDGDAFRKRRWRYTSTYTLCSHVLRLNPPSLRS